MANVIVLAALLAAIPVSAQETRRILFVTVTDQADRYVTGLSQNNLEITENGVIRPITDFVGDDGPIAIAIVSDAPTSIRMPFYTSDDALIETPSLPRALEALAALPHKRKAVILTSAASSQPIPGGIAAIRVNAEAAAIVRGVIEACNQYMVAFDSAGTADVQIRVKPQIGLLRLKATWK